MSEYVRGTARSTASINDELEKIQNSLADKLDRTPDVGQANEMLDDIDMNSNRIYNVPDPVSSQDAVNKEYVDGVLVDLGAQSVTPIEVDRSTGDGVTAGYTVPNSLSSPARSYLVHLDGVRQKPVTDYDVVGTTLTFVTPPANGVAIDITYYEPQVANNLDSVIVFDNVSDAKADLTLVVGDTVDTLGYYVSNDGGGSRYVVVAGGTGTDDGGLYHDLDNGLQLQLDVKGAPNIRQWGAKEGSSNYALVDTAFANIYTYLKSLPQGGSVFVPIARESGFYYNYIAVPEKCGIVGESTTGSRMVHTGTVTGGTIENETKLGEGQEFFFMEKLNINGGVGVHDSLIKLNQVYVNSYINDCIIGDSNGHGIRLIASPDGIADGGGGPIDIKNCWVRESEGHNISVEGSWDGCNIIGGAQENQGTNHNSIHIDGSLYSGARAVVNMWTPYVEYSKLNCIGIYIKKAVVNIYNADFDGTQDATQTNIFVDNGTLPSDVFIDCYKQSVSPRRGIIFDDTGKEITDVYPGVITNKKYVTNVGRLGVADTGTDITLDLEFNKIIRPSGASATSIANFTNVSDDIFVIVPSNGNYTIRNNANIKTKNGSDIIMSSNKAYAFVQLANLYFEI